MTLPLAGSSDNNLLLQSSSISQGGTETYLGINTAPAQAVIPTIEHSAPIRAILPLALTPIERPILLTGSGDVFTAWDVSAFGEPDGGVDVLSKIDAHSHDITGIGSWIRSVDGRKEAWIVTASLDGTIRRWRLEGECLLRCVGSDRLDGTPLDVINRKYEKEVQATYAPTQRENVPNQTGMTLSAEEEAELAELMSDDE